MSETSADLTILGPHLLVPFPVHRLENPRLLWLNERWLLETGINDDIEIEQFGRWLLAHYAVSAPTPWSESMPGHSPQSTFFADRYGGTGSWPHGGSGRCGILGSFNAKGIGCTPLVSQGVDWEHSHGCLRLEEAICEAISSEIACAELPFGAVPIIAIIDAGTHFGDSTNSARRAIVVRPNFARLAHFERSSHGTSGTRGSDQYTDALRTEASIRAVSACPNKLQAAKIAFKDLETVFQTIAAQIGGCWAQRLWQGRFTTGNVTIDGRLVDFGSFRSVPSWRSAVGGPGEAFGNEQLALRTAIDSLCFHFKKYSPPQTPIPNPKELLSRVMKTAKDAFKKTCAENLGIGADTDSKTAATLMELLERYFAAQQREKIYVGGPRSSWRRPWLFDALATNCGPDTQWTDLEREIFACLKGLAKETSSPEGNTLNAALRWLRPRPLLYYENALPRSRQLVARLTGHTATDRRILRRYINDCVSRSRRSWRGLPNTLDAMAQVTDSGSAAIYCKSRVTGRPCVWIEGPVRSGDLYLFRQNIPCSELEGIHIERFGQRVRLTVEALDSRPSQGMEMEIGRRSLRVPPARFLCIPRHVRA